MTGPAQRGGKGGGGARLRALPETVPESRQAGEARAGPRHRGRHLSLLVLRPTQFRHKSEATRHERAHTGEKPCACSIPGGTNPRDFSRLLSPRPQAHRAFLPPGDYGQPAMDYIVDSMCAAAGTAKAKAAIAKAPKLHRAATLFLTVLEPFTQSSKTPFEPP